LRASTAEQEIVLDSDEPPQRVRCNLKEFQFSAHASRESLVSYAKKVGPKKIVLVHGDPPAVDWMRAKLLVELPGVEVIVPAPGVEIEM
jgi:Cft2 family RNA processing exonuclease